MHAQDIKVIVRADWVPSASHVAIVSGGGSGHEPSHAGWVGQGMLTAAVCGDVFASPSVDAVLAAIFAVSGANAKKRITADACAGVLLIVKNYGGDRLNFGLAAERARAQGVRVSMVVVADDCALEGAGPTGRRGIAGTVLVHKVAGAAAAAGGGLVEVTAAAQAAADAMGSMGVATSTCCVPGKPRDRRLDTSGAAEVGLGIHGEPGRNTEHNMTAAAVASTCVDAIFERKRGDDPSWCVGGGVPVALLVNNLGGATPLEAYTVLGDAMEHLHKEHPEVCVAAALSGYFMTSLDMRGVSISVLPLTGAQHAQLLLPVGCPAWTAATDSRVFAQLGVLPPSGVEAGEPAVPVGQFVPLPPLHPPAPPALASSSEAFHLDSSPGLKALLAALRGGAAAVMADEEHITALDVAVGDGDAGTTMCKGAAAVLAFVSSVSGQPASPEALAQHLPQGAEAHIATQLAPWARRGVQGALHALSIACSQFMGGTSGILFSVFCAAAQAAAVAEGEAVSVGTVFAAGVDAVGVYGGAKPGMCTMMDALAPSAAAMLKSEHEGGGVSAVLAAGAAAAATGAAGTATMQVTVGRGAYASEAGHAAVGSTVDAGAAAVASILHGAAAALQE